MKLSTKGLYGTRAILELALHYGKGPLLLKTIAKRQGIPERYLEHLLAALKVVGLVKSIRGAHGGYFLAKPPSQVRLSEVIEILEGSIAPAKCLNDISACPRVDICVTRDLWGRMKDALLDILRSTTLQDLVELQKEKIKPAALMYYI